MTRTSASFALAGIVIWILAYSSLDNVFVDARTHVKPDHETAERNGHHIFNVIHSATRQWGSAMNHNGLSFFPVIVPRGTLLYHGAQAANRPSGAEWMAFEVEHAHAFAFNMESPTRNAIKDANPPGQHPMFSVASKSDSNATYYRGYLQTYRAKRGLNLLYVDGMSAGKTNMGTLDTQDLVLRENKTLGKGDPLRNEYARAESICGILTEWGYDGLMRMEIGFEVIYCDFDKGLDLVMATRTALRGDPSFVANMNLFQWARAVSERYEGIGGDRARVDFSSMVSGYFFPINISSTDPARPDLLRLAAASPDELKDIKMYLEEVAKKPRRFTVQWQAVADMIVTRYAKRLALLAAPNQPFEVVAKELEIATQAYINAPAQPGDITIQESSGHNQTTEALRACKQHYLLPTYLDRESWSPQDHLIHTAMQSVVSDICGTLFAALSIMDGDGDAEVDVDADVDADADAVERKDSGRHRTDGPTPADRLRGSRKLFAELKERLDWSGWRKPQPCAVDEFLFTVMWPMGNSEDYWNPGCRTREQIDIDRRHYWTPDILRGL
ncbi:hypothetical protein QQS21_002315 [Conoideocrella luteorostrata]|uniref:Uncharacterized protein n=1 Tax=Conoideocrella luteorostrata TaxID=1105319 RepID=A0AAJ0CYC8_9HYPO|nr:hypothetical protein QQS21_002315 [Conoideocrella luteorostrata]